jgi:hypothetical protein
VILGDAQYKIVFSVVGGLMIVGSLIYGFFMRGVSTAQVEQG